MNDTVMTKGSIPEVSVIIPAYNHSRYIEEAVNSVLSQTCRDLEVVVIDDGSTDDTLARLKKMEDPRLRVYSQENQGAHAAIMNGIKKAQADWLAILNSDDVYEPQRIERLLHACKGRKEVFAFTQVRLIDAESSLVEDARHPWLRMMDGYLQVWRQSGSVEDALLAGNITATTSNFFFSRALHQRLGALRPLRYVHDWDYALRAVISMPEAVVWLHDEPLLRYRLHGANTILGGAYRNHIEAARLLGWAIEERHGHSVHMPLVKLNNFRRFIRRAEKFRHEQKYAELRVECERLCIDLDWYKQHRQDQDCMIAGLQQQAGILSDQIESLNAEIAGLRRSNEGLEAHVTSLHEQIESRQKHLNEIFSSRLWRWSEPLRGFARWNRQYGVSLKGLPVRVSYLAGIARAQGLDVAVAMLWRRLRNGKIIPVDAGMVNGGQGQAEGGLQNYQSFVAIEKAKVEALRQSGQEKVGALERKPLLSIVVPVYNTPEKMLRAMLDSVRGQIYPHWQLCIADDASPDARVAEILVEYAAADPRIQFVRRSTNGHIVQATNDAMSLAKGEFVLFLDHDDELAPHALLRLAEFMSVNADAEVIYSDEDKIDTEGNRSLPFFKPDWSPALLYAHNYVCHLLCCKRSLLEQVGGLRAGYEGSQDYDLILRLAGVAGRFHHLPEVLYHWRQHEASTALNAGSKPYAHEAGRKALTDHLQQTYGSRFREVEDGEHTFTYVPRFNAPPVRVSIIIPTRDKVELLKQCIDSILGKTVWQDYEILILDNNSVEQHTFDYFESLRQNESRVRVLPAAMEFNWSKLNNYGVEHASGDVFLFLNNDTEVITTDWLERIVEQATLPDVGTVGPLLLYEDNTIQHAGVVVGLGGWADHVFKGEAVRHWSTPWVSSALSRDVLALTGACVAIARSKWHQIGGFDEAFVICGSDVELGIRAYKSGLRNVYLPEVRLYHFESKSRGTSVDPEDFVQSDLKYAPYRLAGDPYFNPNLSRLHTSPTVLVQ